MSNQPSINPRCPYCHVRHDALKTERCRERAAMKDPIRALRRLADPTEMAGFGDATAPHNDTPEMHARITFARAALGDVEYTPAEPLPYLGWKAKAEQRLRRRGWKRLANTLARWDERGLGRG